MLTASYPSSAAGVCHDVLALLLAAARLICCLPELFACDAIGWASCGCVACLGRTMQPSSKAVLLGVFCLPSVGGRHLNLHCQAALGHLPLLGQFQPSVLPGCCCDGCTADSAQLLHAVRCPCQCCSCSSTCIGCNFIPEVLQVLLIWGNIGPPSWQQSKTRALVSNLHCFHCPMKIIVHISCKDQIQNIRS